MPKKVQGARLSKISQENADFGPYRDFGQFWSFLKFDVCYKFSGMMHGDKKSARTISLRNLGVDVGKPTETGGDLQSRSRVAPKTPPKVRPNAKIQDSNTQEIVLRSGRASLVKAPQGAR